MAFRQSEAAHIDQFSGSNLLIEPSRKTDLPEIGRFRNARDGSQTRPYARVSNGSERGGRNNV